jgi:hypothetical protein
MATSEHMADPAGRQAAGRARQGKAKASNMNSGCDWSPGPAATAIWTRAAACTPDGHMRTITASGSSRPRTIQRYADWLGCLEQAVAQPCRPFAGEQHIHVSLCLGQLKLQAVHICRGWGRGGQGRHPEILSNWHGYHAAADTQQRQQQRRAKKIVPARCQPARLAAGRTHRSAHSICSRGRCCWPPRRLPP